MQETKGMKLSIDHMYICLPMFELQNLWTKLVLVLFLQERQGSQKIDMN